MASYGSGDFDLVGVAGFPVMASVDPGSTTTFNLVGAIDTFDITSSSGSAVTINNTVDVASTLNLNTNGGAITIGTLVGALGPVAVTIDNGGSFAVGATTVGLLNNGNITYSTGGGTAVIGTANDFVNLSFAPILNQFSGPTDVLDDRSLQFAGLSSYTVTDNDGNQTITAADSAGNISFTVSGEALPTGSFTIGSGPLNFVADASGGTEISAVCFLEGTRIMTPAGEIAVEALRAGDAVSIMEGGNLVASPITWIGKGHVTTKEGSAEPELTPVRIRAGALGDDLPRRDLLLTPEHCILVEGKLIPVRMLVNGHSIIADQKISVYNYYHIELDDHVILLAEGLTAESYLDTGNRINFANYGIAALKPDFKVNPAHRSWNEHAAAPLAVDRDTVEPIWRRLAARAGQEGSRSDGGRGLTSDPGLYLEREDGTEIRPALIENGVYTFAVPSNTRSLRLVSRAARPADAIGPYIDDRRMLGVLVGRIDLRMGRRNLGSGMPGLGRQVGWHDAEPGTSCRWTGGNAVIPLNFALLQGRPALLEIEIVQAGLYPLEDTSAIAA